MEVVVEMGAAAAPRATVRVALDRVPEVPGLQAPQKVLAVLAPAKNPGEQARQGKVAVRGLGSWGA